MTILRVAVVSDVHADLTSDADSYVAVEPPVAQLGENPMADLLDFVKTNRIRSDLLLCPGDLANKANSAGRMYGWRKLHELATELGAKRVVATPGNHDLVTHNPVPDPRADLRNLVPSFPLGDQAIDQEFWANGYGLVEADQYRILVLDTCADFPVHPGGTASADEILAYKRFLDRGGVTTEALRQIESLMKDLPEKAVNILLCHHHPVEHESRTLFKDTYGPMRQGDDLVRILEANYEVGRWMIIHGHKHVPRLVNGGGTSNSPLVLCAGSTGGKIWAPLNTVTRNQFHLIDFELSRVTGLPRLRGTIQSYMWGYGTRWSSSGRENSGLPAICGFGMAHDHRDLVDQLETHLSKAALEFDSWEHVCAAVPPLRYLGPSDAVMFEAELEARGLFLTRLRDDQIRQVSREKLS